LRINNYQNLILNSIDKNAIVFLYTQPAFIKIGKRSIMIWVPLFKPGVWNAWVLALFVLLHPVVMNWVDKAFGTGDLSQKMGDVPDEASKKKSLSWPALFLVALFILSIFIPLRLGSLWLYAGLGIYFTGIVIFLSAIITAAKTPVGKVFTQGIYRYSRHPLYLSFFTIFLGISVASLSWLFLVLSMLWMIIPLSQVSSEEQLCFETFGVPYQDYLKRTPKWLGIPKSR
jgi:protein-S-isoprenylcysteine O-methyltransferase Ste14